MADPYYSNVSLMLHLDGANNSTTFTDTSPTPKTCTGYNGMVIGTGQSKFGGASLYFSDANTSPYPTIETPGDAAFDFGTGDFTIECFVWLSSTAGYKNICLRDAGGNYSKQYFSIYNNGATAQLRYYHLGPTGIPAALTLLSGALSATTWYHVAVSRVSGTTRMYVDGVVVASDSSASSSADISFSEGAAPFIIGYDYGTSIFRGYIDEFRVTKGVGRYVSDFTPTTVPFLDSSQETAIVAATCPIQQLSATGSRPGGWADTAISAPSPTLSSYTGARASNIYAPIQLLSCTAHDAYGDNAAFLTAPSATLTAYGGANAKLTAPRPHLGVAGIATILGTLDLSPPSAVLTATGIVTELASADLTFYEPYTLKAYSGAVCSITLTGRASVQAAGTTGGIGGAQITAPLFELTASGTAQPYGSANLLAPSPKLGATAQAWLIAPMGRLTAIGTAVITATYEAYAVNLKHTPRGNEQPIDETTRYTNFQFTHVVRYLNSYYGANSTGLYLLEGTTDDATPIPFAVKTAMTDFKSPTKKTLASAYFGGRFGPASTIKLHAGEQAPNSYAYSTPRDTLAQNYRQVFGKGLKERYYSLEATGTGTLELDSIELDVHNLTRRI